MNYPTRNYLRTVERTTAQVRAEASAMGLFLVVVLGIWNYFTSFALGRLMLVALGAVGGYALSGFVLDTGFHRHQWAVWVVVVLCLLAVLGCIREAANGMKQMLKDDALSLLWIALALGAVLPSLHVYPGPRPGAYAAERSAGDAALLRTHLGNLRDWQAYYESKHLLGRALAVGQDITLYAGLVKDVEAGAILDPDLRPRRDQLEPPPNP